MTHDVVVVGSANADLVVQVPRRPGGGETLLGGDLHLLPGGKGANQAAAAGRCGADVAFLGCIGDDANGGFLRAQLEAAGVDTSMLGTVERPSGTAIIFLTPDGENSIVVSPGANHAFDLAGYFPVARPQFAGDRLEFAVCALEFHHQNMSGIERTGGCLRIVRAFRIGGDIAGKRLRIGGIAAGFTESEARDITVRQ